MYSASLNFGVSLGIITAGLVTINLSWRYIYWIAAALIGCLTIVVYFTMPETSYNRSAVIQSTVLTADSKDQLKQDIAIIASMPDQDQSCTLPSLRIFNGTLTSESLSKLFLRPTYLLLLPPILWSTWVMSVTIGFLVAITSNFATAFSDTYTFDMWQSGLCFIAGLIGSGFGIFFGGYFSDMVANFFTRRNGGVRDPEFRLPAMMIGLVTTPLALVLYGVSLEHSWHWSVPTIAMGLLNFSIAQATNISLVYIVDGYRPIAGEAVVTQLAFKSAFGFLLSFYTNSWIEETGYQCAFGEMAAIAGCVLICWVPFFVWGKQIRKSTLRWRIVRRFVQWDEDRYVGE